MIATRERRPQADYCTWCGSRLNNGVYYVNRVRVCVHCARLAEEDTPDMREIDSTRLLGAVIVAIVLGWVLLLWWLLR